MVPNEIPAFIVSCAIVSVTVIGGIICAIFGIAMFVTYAIGYIKDERKKWK